MRPFSDCNKGGAGAAKLNTTAPHQRRASLTALLAVVNPASVSAVDTTPTPSLKDWEKEEGLLRFPAADGWGCVSESAKDLVRKMLSDDPRKRPSATGLLQHSWITQSDAVLESSPLKSPPKLRKLLVDKLAAGRLNDDFVSTAVKMEREHHGSSRFMGMSRQKPMAKMAGLNVGNTPPAGSRKGAAANVTTLAGSDLVVIRPTESGGALMKQGRGQTAVQGKQSGGPLMKQEMNHTTVKSASGATVTRAGVLKPIQRINRRP